MDTPYTLRKGETAITKANLIVGAYYRGRCRNAELARWDGAKFHHWRTKFGNRFIETINHPEDDNGFDCFTPIMSVFRHDVGERDAIQLSLPVWTKINPGYVISADIAKEKS